MTSLFGRPVWAISLFAMAALAGNLFISSSARAEDSLAVPDIGQLCPVAGLSGLKFGLPRGNQDKTTIEAIERGGTQFAPFEEVHLVYTPWSDRLAAVEWSAPIHGADVSSERLEEWLWTMDQTFQADGWGAAVHGDETRSFGWSARLLEREFDTPDGKHMLWIEFDAPGALAMRCADPEMLALKESEELGELAPGSPRPHLLAVEARELPDRTRCDDPATQEIFASSDKLRASGIEIEDFIPAASADYEKSKYGERLQTWLIWRMKSSGRIEDAQIWDVVDAAAPEDENVPLETMMGFLADATEMLDAQNAGKGGDVCRGMIKMLEKQRKVDAEKAMRFSIVNAALEAEAARRGIALD